ncbi:hypothetical protein Tco_1505931 [Tanacetum coccineum]
MAETYYGDGSEKFSGACWAITDVLLRFRPIAIPLTQLMIKGENLCGRMTVRRVFEGIETENGVWLRYWTLHLDSGGFQIYMMASKKGLGCVLMQHGKSENPGMIHVFKSIILRDLERLVLSYVYRSKKLTRDYGDVGANVQKLKTACREKVMTEAHSSPFTIHPGQKLNIRGLLVVTAVWRFLCGKWDEISREFSLLVCLLLRKDIDSILVVVESANQDYRSFGELVLSSVQAFILKSDEKSITSYWDEVVRRLIEGPELIEITNEKVVVAKEKLKEARSRQKSYADKHRRDLEFQVGDRVFLKVSPFRGVKRFGIKGKLSPRFIVRLRFLET